MNFGPKCIVRAGITVAVVCFIVAGMASTRTAAQQTPGQGPVMSHDIFKSVVLLRGIPVDNFFEAMGMFASAMGDDCTFCHVKGAYFNRREFATATPRIQRARQMIVMMNTLNKNYFGGQNRVTCFTCHRSSFVPSSEPELALQYGPPVENPNARDFPIETRFKADEIFNKYLAAIGGAQQAAKLTSFTAKGVYSGFDTGRNEVPVEIYAAAPNKRAMIVHVEAGDSVRIYNGDGGWMAGPDVPVPLLTLTGGNLDRARLEALLQFPANIRQAYSEWRVGRTDIDDDEVLIVQGLDKGRPAANFYFDGMGMLIRVVRWTDTPVGGVPTQIDYEDYRDVAGVKIPFRTTVSQTYMQAIIALKEVQPNVTIDPARFAQPSASATPALAR